MTAGPLTDFCPNEITSAHQASNSNKLHLGAQMKFMHAYIHLKRVQQLPSLVQGRMASPSQQEQQEDEEKAALRDHIHQLEQAAARADWESHNLAAASQATDEERLEAALQQEQLQARIHQLEVVCSSVIPVPACSMIM